MEDVGTKQAVPPQPQAPQVVAPPTPPSTDMAQKVPGSLRLRFAAAFFDGLIIAVPINFLSVLSRYLFEAINLNDSISVSIIWLLILMVLSVFYYIYFNVKKGATPGKRMYGLRVVDLVTNKNLTFKFSTLREIVNRGIIIIPILGYLFGVVNFFVMLSNPERRGIHDKVANSQVYKVRKSVSIWKQIGFFVAILIISFIPFLLILPQSIDQAQELNSCVQECVADKTSTVNLTSGFENVGETCLQECSE